MPPMAARMPRGKRGPATAMKSKPKKQDTTVVTAGRHPEDHHGAVNPPVYHVSTVLYPSVAELEAGERPSEARRITYGRSGTPTTFALEDAVAALEGGHGCQSFPSGLAAVSSALLAFLNAGDRLLMVDSVYQPTRRFCEGVLRRMGIETAYYDPLIGGAIDRVMTPNTAVVFVESPGSLTFEVQDVPAIAAAAHGCGAMVIMDNTWASPLFFKPFEHGVDVSIQAATKYIVGHADAMLGTACATEAAMPALRRTARNLGTHAAPDDCYLGQRGLRTLSVRLARHQASALRLAGWVEARAEVERVMYPALATDSGHAIWRRDFTGASGLFGVVLAPASHEAVAAMLDGLELFGMGYSWGGYESLIVPTDPAEARTATPWDAPGTCLRIHVGLEDPDDLIADLEAGFARLTAAR